MILCNGRFAKSQITNDWVASPQGRKALFAAPQWQLPEEGYVTLRLRRGYYFCPDVTMTSSWLQEQA